MSLFNIATQQTRSINVTNDWDLNIDQYQINNNNFHNISPATNTQTQDTLIIDPSSEPINASSDRFTHYSSMFSSRLDSLINRDTVKNYLSPLPITISQTLSAYRSAAWNMFLGKFIENYPTIYKYYIPTQNINTIFTHSISQWAKQHKISDKTYDLFLPENYLDEFGSKQIILTPFLNNELSTMLNSAVLTAYCSQSDDCANISANFIQPTFDNNDSNYFDANNFGISFDALSDFDPETTEFEPIILDVKYSNEVIVNIVYDPIYAGSEVVIKHILINNYHVINLPNTDSEISL